MARGAYTDRDFAEPIAGIVPTWPASPSAQVSFHKPRELRPDEPALFRIDIGLEGTSLEATILANAAGPVVSFQWPGALRVISMWWGTLSGSDVDLAGMRVSIVCENQDQLITDGQLPQTAYAFAGFGGSDHAPFQLERRVRGGDVWQFQCFNDNPVNAINPRLYLGVRSDKRGEVL